MPKATITNPKTRVTKKCRAKFKIAGRKSTKSALTMSTVELVEMANDKNAGRRRQIASVVLDKRGIDWRNQTQESA